MREPEPVLVVDLFPLERQQLLQLLAQLREEEWHGSVDYAPMSQQHYFTEMVNGKFITYCGQS